MKNRFKPRASDLKVFPENVPATENIVERSTSNHQDQVFPDNIVQELEIMSHANSSRKPSIMETGYGYKPKQGNPSIPDGQDAHFLCPWNQTIGVADGVGGWSDSGIDAGHYARGIMGNIIMAFVEKPSSNPSIDLPYLSKILKVAHRNTRVPGSSTVCLLALSGDELLCLNVGDSGFRVIRKGKTAYASQPQVKAFNTPYQLGCDVGDKPSLALQIRVRVEVGDVVIVGTDGLFDNVFKWELEDLVKNGTCSRDTPQGVAQKILEFAHLKSIDKECCTPFSVESKMAGKPHIGGKKDDITVVVAYIV